mgnify:CR=1 FL=1
MLCDIHTCTTKMTKITYQHTERVNICQIFCMTKYPESLWWWWLCFCLLLVCFFFKKQRERDRLIELKWLALKKNSVSKKTKYYTSTEWDIPNIYKLCVCLWQDKHIVTVLVVVFFCIMHIFIINIKEFITKIRFDSLSFNHQFIHSIRSFNSFRFVWLPIDWANRIYCCYFPNNNDNNNDKLTAQHRKKQMITPFVAVFRSICGIYNHHHVCWSSKIWTNIWWWWWVIYMVNNNKIKIKSFGHHYNHDYDDDDYYYHT